MSAVSLPHLGRTLALLGVTIAPSFGITAATDAAPGGVAITAAYQIPNVTVEPTRPESAEGIEAAKRQQPDLGSTVYLYVRNRTSGPLSLEDIVWDGAGVEAHAAGPRYQAIWWRMLPGRLPPAAEGEVALCLRTRLRAPTEFTVRFSGGHRAAQVVAPEPPPFRIASVAFGEGLRKAYVAIERTRPGLPVPRRLTLDGGSVPGRVRWLSPGYAAGVRLAVVTPRQPFEPGRTCVFRASSSRASAGAALRALTDFARFGTYGYGDVERYAASGLNLYQSFGRLDRAFLDRAGRLGVKACMTIGAETAPPAETIGHPALAGYLMVDEPDVQDYGADRPMPLRIGTMAQRMVRTTELCQSADPRTPTRITVDLTFTPYNYFIYGQIADVVNPDCYPITIGWPVRAVREKAAVVKRAAGPRPFTFTFQGCWEEYAIPQPNWVSRAAILRDGRDRYVDPARTRGLGRAPVPAEVRMQMLYAIGCGARGLVSYTDATEAGGALIFHSSAELPEIWHEIGRTTRALRLVAPLLELSHPVEWARAAGGRLWAKTLLCGDLGALVVVVNEDCFSGRLAFTLNPARHVRLRFPDLPWLSARSVCRVEDGALIPLPSRRDGAALTWVEPEVGDGAVYLLPASAGLVRELEARARREPPVATEEGKRPGPETYLKERRSRWTP